ncbi:MAG: MFS transporter [Zoogloeaceae bacterium]|jgi:predicted MFS family arabinose efflux permease|nr:MFS transporter [Zoogloeaceae bacterium]
MSGEERRVGISLAAIFSLRMLGLFLILPVFALYAPSLPGGDDKTLVGLALGAYGGTQACLQIAWGMASDRWGRKPVIVAGLLLFALGSGIAAWAPDIHWVIAGRVIQGAGAISAAITALAADLTREEHRTKVMAMIGSSIGLIFALSMAIASPLFAWIGMPGIFALTGVLALAAIFVLWKNVPTPVAPASLPPPAPLAAVLREPQLLRLNFGVFVLHLTQMALWVLIPHALTQTGHLPVSRHWLVYLPAVLLALAGMVPAVIAAEKRGKMKPVFLGAIFLLLMVLAGLYFAGGSVWSLFFWLTLFFIAFNILEATQPSLISRLAPAQSKGKALGLYNTLQAVGLFVGGLAGGALAQHSGPGAVFLFCALMVVSWLALACGLKTPSSGDRRQVTGDRG